MKTPKVKFGVLGPSRVAQKGMLPALCDANFAELVMVGSRSPERAKNIAVQFDCDSYGTYEDVLNNPEVQAVYISVPNSLHEEWAIKALQAKKHVLLEKPAAMTYAAAKRMTDAARENGVRLLEGLMFRFHPQHDKVKELIKNGTLGELTNVEGCFAYAMPDADSNALNKELGGGVMSACGTYPIYASRMLFGAEPEAVMCRLNFDPTTGVDVKAEMLVWFKDGKSALLSAGFGAYYQSTYAVLGSKAYLKLLRAYAVPRDMRTKIFLDKDDKISEMETEPGDHFRLMADDFAEEILKGQDSTKNYEEDLLNQARAYEAAVRSGNENRIVNISEIN